MGKRKEKPCSAAPVIECSKPNPPIEDKAWGVMTGTEVLTKDGKGIPIERSKVAVVGFAPTSMEEVKPLFDDPTCEIWGLNQLYVAFPKIAQYATRWVQIHPRHSYDINLGRDKSHHQWLVEQRRFPIYMMDRDPSVPMSVRWPKEKIMQLLGTDYFTNSISWEIALPIYETLLARLNGKCGFTDIYIFGVDMAQSDEIDSEYAEQRPSCEFFVGIAWGLGLLGKLGLIGHYPLRVHIPNKSDLLKTLWLYPYEDHSPFRTKLEARRQELRNRANILAAQEQQSHDARMQIVGAIEDIHYTKQCWDSSINEVKAQSHVLRDILEGKRKPID